MTTRGARIAIAAGSLSLLFALLPAASAAGSDILVLDTGDLADVNPGDGVCDGDSSIFTVRCTLRAAIQTANGPGAPGFDRILVPANTYNLTINNLGGDEDAAATGDLDLTTDMEITGFGGTATINGLIPPAEDRVFQIPAGNPSQSVSLD